MKKTTFAILILLLFFPGLFGQDLKFKKNTLNTYLKENFYVLSSNKKIKSGPYFLIYRNDTTLIGQYKDNKRSGVWIFKGYENDTVFTYDYDKEQVISWKCQDNFQKCDPNNSPAIFSYGFSMIQARVVTELRYPTSAQENGIQGKATVLMIINTEGNITSPFIGQSTGNLELDKEAIRVVKESCRGEWIPARDNKGDLINDTVSFNVVFKCSNY